MKFPKLNISTEFRRPFKTEESRFVIFTGLKVSLISLFITVTVYLWLYELMRLNWVFFKTQGFPEVLGESSFFSYLGSEAVNNLHLILIFHITLFFIGCYVGWLILRPFRTIAEYCDEALENQNAVYALEEFSTYKLLARFSEFFFEFLRESRRKGVLTQNSIPPQYSKIHKPLTDYIFMLHFGLLMVIIAISSIVFITENAATVYDNLAFLSERTLKTSAANKFVAEQIFIIQDIAVLTMILITVCYLLLAFHLYEKVSGAAFGIFSTMRAFMKGNYSSRVHLVGYAYVREYTRRLNKYLDFIQNNYSKEDPKG